MHRAVAETLSAASKKSKRWKGTTISPITKGFAPCCLHRRQIGALRSYQAAEVRKQCRILLVPNRTRALPEVGFC
eukprot:c42296_g1_i1 orf=71-295(+)